MNIAMTLLTAGIVSLAPPVTTSVLSSPITAVDISVAGISVEIDATGAAITAADTPDFTATAQLSSGSTIRVRL